MFSLSSSAIADDMLAECYLAGSVLLSGWPEDGDLEVCDTAIGWTASEALSSTRRRRLKRVLSYS